jgi:hypothetical protein
MKTTYILNQNELINHQKTQRLDTRKTIKVQRPSAMFRGFSIFPLFGKEPS